MICFAFGLICGLFLIQNCESAPNGLHEGNLKSDLAKILQEDKAAFWSSESSEEKFYRRYGYGQPRPIVASHLTPISLDGTQPAIGYGNSMIHPMIPGSYYPVQYQTPIFDPLARRQPMYNAQPNMIRNTQGSFYPLNMHPQNPMNMHHQYPMNVQPQQPINMYPKQPINSEAVPIFDEESNPNGSLFIDTAMVPTIRVGQQEETHVRENIRPTEMVEIEQTEAPVFDDPKDNMV